MDSTIMDGQATNLVMLPRDAPTDVLNELQLVVDFYGADTAADHQRVMALFAPNARLDLPQMFVSGRDNISAVMFYAKSFVADVDIEPYMVEVGVGCANGVVGPHHTATTSTAPTSSTTSTDSTSSTCTSAATSKRRRSSKPPKAPSGGGGGGGGAGPSNANGRQQQPSRLGRKHSQSAQQQQQQQHGSGADVHRPRSRHHQHSDQTATTEQADGATGFAQNQSAAVPGPMSQTHVYAVATITPKALLRALSLNLLPR
jgi:hypothetical protein